MMGHREDVAVTATTWDRSTAQGDLLDRPGSTAGAGQSTSRFEPEVSLC